MKIIMWNYFSWRYAFMSTVILHLLKSSQWIADALAYLAPPDRVAVDVLTSRSIKVRWNMSVYSEALVFRVTLSPHFAAYQIMKDVPASVDSVIIDNLIGGFRYNLTVQSADKELFSAKSPVVQFYINASLQSEENETDISWSQDPYGGGKGPKTEEIVIVSIVFLFWAVTMFWFKNSWAKIRVIEPRYFDYKFLMKYDKAFAVRNAVISGAGSSNGPRRSIARSVTGTAGIGSGAARPSFSAVSIRSNEQDTYPREAIFPYLPARQLLLPLRSNQHRHSYDVRCGIELNRIFPKDDNEKLSPVSV